MSNNRSVIIPKKLISNQTKDAENETNVSVIKEFFSLVWCKT